jgi:hypothetical protein
MKTTLLVLVILLAPLSGVPAAAGPQGGAGHFSQGGLAFDYPAAWTLADTSNDELQRAVLTRAGGSNIIVVFAQRELIKTPSQLYAARTGVTMPYVANIARKLDLSRPPPPDEAQCLNVGGRPAVAWAGGSKASRRPPKSTRSSSGSVCCTSSTSAPIRTRPRARPRGRPCSTP